MMGTVSTYLLIMMQFRPPRNIEDEDKNTNNSSNLLWMARYIPHCDAAHLTQKIVICFVALTFIINLWLVYHKNKINIFADMHDVTAHLFLRFIFPVRHLRLWVGFVSLLRGTTFMTWNSHKMSSLIDTQVFNLHRCPVKSGMMRKHKKDTQKSIRDVENSTVNPYNGVNGNYGGGEIEIEGKFRVTGVQQQHW